MFNFIKKTASGGSSNPNSTSSASLGVDASDGQVKKRSTSKVSKEELLRLYENRRSLKLRPKKRKEKEKLPSGIVADYTASLFANLNYTDPLNAQIVNSDSSETSSGTGANFGPGAGIGEKPSPLKPIDSSTGAISSPASIDDISTATTTTTSTDSFSAKQDNWSFDKLNTLPDIVNVATCLHPRVVKIHRQNRYKNDFGFLLRRAIAVKQNSKEKTVDEVIIFAEPGKKDNIGLLPGDKLLEINGISVTNWTRDDIIDKIRNSKDFVTLKYSIKYLTGLLRGSTNTSAFSFDETDVCLSDRYWLVHKNGYSDVRKVCDIETNSEQVAVRYHNDGNLVFVDEHYLEKANPIKDCLVGNLIDLNFLNETNVIHTLRQRYASNLPYTFMGPCLVSLKPHVPVSIFSDKVSSMFRGCKRRDTPPHIYSVAQSTYFEMLTQTKNNSHLHQSIIVQGRRLSGKSFNVKQILEYFSDLSNQSFITKEQLNAIFVVLDAAGCFGFGQVFQLSFDLLGTLIAFNVQQFLVDKFTVYLSHDQVPILEYLLVNGHKQLPYKNEFYLNGHHFDEILSKKSPDDRKRAHCEFLKFLTAMNRLNVTDHEMKVIWQLLAAIFHLKHVSVIRNNLGRNQFSDATAVENACNILELNLEHFKKHIFGPSNSSLKLSVVSEHLVHFTATLYSEFVNILTYFINRNFVTQSKSDSLKHIYVVKVPHLSCEKDSKNVSLNDLFHNYFHERFLRLFWEKHILEHVDKLKEENIQYDGEIENTLNSALIKLIDSKSRNSLFSILDDEPNEATFIDSVHKLIDTKDNRNLIRKVPHSSDKVVLQHCQSTCAITYSLSNWFRDYSRSGLQKSISACLLECRNETLKSLINDSKHLSSSVICNKLKISENNSLLRISCLRRATANGSGKGNSTLPRKSTSRCFHVKVIADNLMDVLRQTQTCFVFCLDADSLNASDGYVNVSALRQQISNYGLIRVLRFHKQNYPECLSLSDFIRMFVTESMVADGRIIDNQCLVVELLQKFEIDVNEYKLGSNKVFLRDGVLNTLEYKRNEKLTPLVKHLQAQCRGYLARKAYEKNRVQDLAVRCIQKNIRTFFYVRDWSWWRLLIQIRPLLNIHRIEDELQSKTKDLELLLSKVDKLEKENSQLQAKNEKFGTQISELTLDLAEERSSSALLSEKYENESSLKLNFEEKLFETENLKRCLEDEKSQLKEELECLKALDSALDKDLENSNDADNDNDNGHNIYKKRLEHSTKEIGFLKKRIQEQHECDLEQMIGLKKQLEKKLADAYEEIDEQRQVGLQWKKRFQKTVDEISDVKLLLEQQNSRNSQLEKKQKKFDQELLLVMDDLVKEKSLKDRFHRDREILSGEKFLLESTITELKTELDLKEEKIEHLQREIDEASTLGLSNAEIVVLKRQKADLENRTKELEEELDEMAGQIHQLEQNRMRLEMNLDHQRKENRLESAQRDDEIENLRNSYQKKLKNIELQIETEREERSALVREKRELEKRLDHFIEVESNEHANDQVLVAKLKRNFKKLSMLYNDAKLELELRQNDGKSKAIIRQLKNKIEDLECDLQSTTKLRQNLEHELLDYQNQLEETKKIKIEVENRVSGLNRQVIEQQLQLEENEEEFNDLHKKYESQIEKINKESILSRQNFEFETLESDDHKSHLIEHLTKLTSELESLVSSKQEENNIEEIRLRTKELESKLEIEQLKRSRHETQISRLKDCVEKLQSDLSRAQLKEKQTEDNVKRIQKLLKDTKDELVDANNKVIDMGLKKASYEKKIESLEAELTANKADLKFALKRIEDLQGAIKDDLNDMNEYFDDFDDHNGDSLDEFNDVHLSSDADCS